MAWGEGDIWEEDFLMGHSGKILEECLVSLGVLLGGDEPHGIICEASELEKRYEAAAANELCFVGIFGEEGEAECASECREHGGA